MVFAGFVMGGLTECSRHGISNGVLERSLGLFVLVGVGSIAAGIGSLLRHVLWILGVWSTFGAHIEGDL